MHELIAHRDCGNGEPLYFWRSASGFEVDFILADHTAIEVKAKANVAARDLKSLRALAEEEKLKRFLCVSLEPRRRIVDGIQVLPIRDFLKALWAGQFRPRGRSASPAGPSRSNRFFQAYNECLVTPISGAKSLAGSWLRRHVSSSSRRWAPVSIARG